MDQAQRQQYINAAREIVRNHFQVARDSNDIKLQAITNTQIEWNDAWTHHDKPDYTTEMCWTLFFAALAFVPGALYTTAISYALAKEFAVAKNLYGLRGPGWIMTTQPSEFFATYERVDKFSKKYKDLLSLGADQGRNAITRIQSMTNLSRTPSGPMQISAGAATIDTAIMAFKDQLGAEKTRLTSHEHLWTELVNECMGFEVNIFPQSVKITITPDWVTKLLGEPAESSLSISTLSDQYEKQLWMSYVAKNVLLSEDSNSIYQGMEKAQFNHILSKGWVWHIHEVQDLLAWGAQIRPDPKPPVVPGLPSGL
jgi:hypothetical protein